jgi:short-subunit dehydrogenase
VIKLWALITGASSGLGLEFSYILADKGYDLILVSRNEEMLNKLKNNVKTNAVVLSCDLSNINECKNMLDKIKNYDIEVVINNAGFGDCALFHESNIEKSLNMIDLNIKALHLITYEMVGRLKNKKAYILNVASVAGLLNVGPYMSTYYATKSYVVSLTLGIKEELKDIKSPLYIGALCPGPVNTNFNKNANVKFSLKGISAKYCAMYAIKKMYKKKGIIIPKFIIRISMKLQRLLPLNTIGKITKKEQKKKIY